MSVVRVRVQYFEDCPSWRVAADHLDALRDEFGLDIEFELIDTPEAAERVGFLGSPSIVVDDHDLFDMNDAEVGLGCRLYATPDGPAGSPTLEQVREALLRRARRGK